ncbi:MAG: SDR family oxidoreductase [Chitinophagaceae bacterium]|nr:MAG: SDR family oxidoreductase [Chitinophagaceae bacterium]
MNYEISQMVIAITGASSGIGKSIATELAARAAKLVLGARRTEELKKTVDEIITDGGEAACLKIDVKYREDLIRLVELATKKYGRLDVIINNAGVCRLSKIDELDVDGWDEMIDINLKGGLYGIAAAIPVFKNQGYGHIVNIISTSGINISPMQAVYAGTKNALRTIAEAFRQESDGKIRITGISPGYVKTDFARKGIAAEELKEVMSKVVESIAISPQAIADAVVYAITQPEDVEVGDIIIRPAAQH